MNNNLENVKVFAKKQKKKIAMVIGGIILLGGIGTVGIYSIIKSNVNYSVEDAKEIALRSVGGEVLGVNKKIELEDLDYEYEFKIKTGKNLLMEVTVDSRYGVVTDIDNCYE